MYDRFYLIVVLSLAMFFTLTAPVRSQIRSVQVGVDGMACPFCAFGVEKKLKDVEGVETVAVDTEAGRATVSAQAGESIDVRDVPGAVERAGFTPGTMTARAVGYVERDENGRFYLLSPEGDRLFVLHDLTESQEATLRGAAASRLEIEGKVHTHVERIPGLLPETIREHEG